MRSVTTDQKPIVGLYMIMTGQKAINKDLNKINNTITFKIIKKNFQLW
jgi:hypothetical protein